MAADRSDDAADQPDERPDHPADRPNPPADDAKQSRRDQIEPRSRQEVYDAQRATESPEQTEPARRSEPSARSKPPENAHQAQPGSNWDDQADQARKMWGQYERHWSAEERAPVDKSKVLSHEVNIQLEMEYNRTAQRERDTISPKVCEVESRDPDRHLVGFEHRLKDLDRVKEKVYDDIDLLGRSPREAISLLPDAVRYTFQYEEARYTQGVWADIERMKGQGFEMVKLKNMWSDDQYKGINSQWIEPDTGQRFELQFHTRISFEAKEITHGAYERLRTHPDEELEVLVLEAFQRKVTDSVPVPPGATGIPDYSEGEWHDG